MKDPGYLFLFLLHLVVLLILGGYYGEQSFEGECLQ